MNEQTNFEGNVSDMPADSTPQKKKVGFAAMDPEKRRKISSAGGKAVHKRGTAHTFSKEEARIFGSKGGKAPRRPKK